jgi:hypothetical protein
MKDIEVAESHIGTQLSDRHSRQDNGAFAEEYKVKDGKIPSIAAIQQAGEAEPEPAVYAQGNVTGYTESTQFDYRA